MTDHDTFLAEYSTWVDRVHRSTPDANIPPADLWQRILAQANPQPKETKQMSSIKTATVPMTPAVPVDSRIRGGFGHYMNLAATIALVMAVAVAGWFATMQLNPSGGSENRFALLGQTDETATCDVDALTVDEVMEIVRNPYRYMVDRADPDSQALVSYQFAAEQELMVGNIVPSWHEFNAVSRVTPSEAEFEEASQAANAYIACLQHATWGQYWAMYHPVAVQQDVLAQFPVFADEESVRTHVESVINEELDPRFNTLEGFYTAYGEVAITANPDVEKADLILYGSADIEPTIAMGVLVTDESGEVIMETGSTGYPHQIRQGSITERPVIVVQKSSVTGEWYVLPLGSR